jgi:hypothetical protein
MDQNNLLILMVIRDGGGSSFNAYSNSSVVESS